MWSAASVPNVRNATSAKLGASLVSKSSELSSGSGTIGPGVIEGVPNIATSREIVANSESSSCPGSSPESSVSIMNGELGVKADGSLDGKSERSGVPKAEAFDISAIRTTTRIVRAFVRRPIVGSNEVVKNDETAVSQTVSYCPLAMWKLQATRCTADNRQTRTSPN